MEVWKVSSCFSFGKGVFCQKSFLLHALALFARQAGLTLSPSESRHNVKLGSHSALPTHPNTFLATTASQFTLWFLRNLVWTEKMLEMPHDKKTWHCHQGRAIKMSSHSALPLLSPPKLLHLNCYTCGIQSKPKRYMKWHMTKGTRFNEGLTLSPSQSHQAQCTSSLVTSPPSSTQTAFFHASVATQFTFYSAAPPSLTPYLQSRVLKLPKLQLQQEQVR